MKWNALTEKCDIKFDRNIFEEHLEIVTSLAWTANVCNILNKRQILDVTGKTANRLFHGCCKHAGAEGNKEFVFFTNKFHTTSVSGNFDTK